MKKMKSTIGILAIAFVVLTVMSCKDNKKTHNNDDGHHTEMKGEDSSKKEHDNSDGHHDKENKTFACPMHPNMTGKEGDECSECGMKFSEMKENSNDNASASNESDINISTQKNAATTSIIDAYIQIKNGLVADNKNDAVKGGTALLAAFAKFDMSTLKGDIHKEYMEIMESAKEHAEHIVKSDIAHQREHFEVLSTDVNDLITLLGTEKTLYHDFCPMANNNKGAYWLSEVKEIKNPYFGAKMMKCGSVKKQIN